MAERLRQEVIDDRYVLLERLGSGGEAEVYQARDTLLGREVALKVLREKHAESTGWVQRFREEGRNAASVSHPNVVEVYELGTTPEGAHFLALEYVRGGTLKQRLSGSGRLEPAAAATIAAQISRALEAAHSQGVVHGDVRPRNILLDDASARVKVANFGIAHAPSSVAEDVGRLENARYISPEQASGEAAGPSGDLYSLGVVLYEMITGIPPFSGSSQAATVLKHIHEPPPPPGKIAGGIPEELEALTLELLAKDPDHRPRDATGLAGRLEGLSEVLPVKGIRDGPAPGRTHRSGHRASGLVARLRGIREALRPAIRNVEPERVLKRFRRRRRFAAAVTLTFLTALLGLNLFGVGDTLPYGQGTSGPGAAEMSPQSAGASENPADAVVHTADTDNTSANSTYLDISGVNGNPEAMISITQNWNPGSRAGTYNPHPVGVWYDASRERWAVFNQDRAAMPEGVSFNVVVLNDGST
jgi:tRNA A-37 threonylcarbamoyl transferase component Bud32